MSNFPLPYSSLRRSRKPIRPRKKAEVTIGKVSGKVRLSGAAMENLREIKYRKALGRCEWPECGKLLPLYGSVFTRAHLAHIQSRGAGGSDSEANTRILCPPHHLISEHTKGEKG